MIKHRFGYRVAQVLDCSPKTKKQKGNKKRLILLVDSDVKIFLASRVCSSCHFPGVYRDHFNRPFGYILLPE